MKELQMGVSTVRRMEILLEHVMADRRGSQMVNLIDNQWDLLMVHSTVSLMDY